MDNATQNQTVEQFLKFCPYHEIVFDEFPSEKYFVNHVIVCVVNGVLILPTVLLNAISILTIQKSSQLKEKVSYFLIFLQSIADLFTGVLSMVLHTIHLQRETQEKAECIFMLMAMKSIYVSSGLSLATLLAMNLERYIGVLHPYFHRTHLTRGRIFKLVTFGAVVTVATVALSFFKGELSETISTSFLIFFIAFTVFVYARIFLTARKALRSYAKRTNTSEQNTSHKNRLAKELKLAKSCFLAVICFVICWVPEAVIVFVGLGLYDFLFYRAWAITLGMLNSLFNSVIFFWTKPLLRKEASKIVKSTLRA